MTRVATIGAGRMGCGIALAYALAGDELAVVDFKQRTETEHRALASRLQDELSATLDDLAFLGRISPEQVGQVLDRIQLVGVDDAAAVLADAELVYEGVPETREAKQDALGRLGELVPESALICSTTSTMLATELAPMVDHPERFLNAHWLNPAFVIPLVEISVHPGTSDHAVQRLRQNLSGIGKVSVVMGASPGFIVPRLQALIMNEAARMVEEGVASAAEIDRATRYGLGFRFAALGVLEFIDFGGNDILFHAGSYLAETLDPHRYAVPEIVAANMQAGRNGLRDGRGFFDYDVASLPAYRRDVLARVLGMQRHLQPRDPTARADAPQLDLED